MSSAPTPQEIWKDAHWLAQAVDPNAGLVRMVDMTPAAYREASFLDDRMFQQPRTSHLLKWSDVAAAMPADARRDARWIFHISHVGSTLIARLLGELEGVLSIREPRALRDLTFFPSDVRAPFIPVVQSLFSRTFTPKEAALVKTTSFIGEMVDELVPPGAPALFLYTNPRSFIAGILSGPNSRKEMAGRVEVNAARMASRGVHLPPPRSEADIAASAWACGMTALEAANGTNILWADFDRVIMDLESWLRRIADFFGFEASPQRIAEVGSGPLASRYSKATEYPYSSELRNALMARAEQLNRADMARALAMLASAAETAPLLKKALDRARAEN
jgi:hypothetical protein